MKTKGALSLTAEEVGQAKHLAALGYSVRHIGRELRRSAHTVARLLKKPGIVKEVAVEKVQLADLFEKLTHQTLESITLSDIQKASLLQRVTSAGIMVDKTRLLRGESTENINVAVLLDVAHLIRERRTKQDDGEDLDPAHTIPAPAVLQRVLPAPIALPALTNSPRIAIPVAIPVQSKTELPPTPSVRVKYYTPIVPEKDSENENPLMRGLRTP